MVNVKEIERSIIKRYRKYIWTPFIKSISEHSLLKKGDIIAVFIDGTAKSYLMAKCFQELKRHGKIEFEIIFFCAMNAFLEIKNNCDMLDIELTNSTAQNNNLDELYLAAKNLGANKISLATVFERLSENVLYNLICQGVLQTKKPQEKLDDLVIIRPLYFLREKGAMLWSNFTGLSFYPETCDFKHLEIRKDIDSLNEKYHLAEFNIVKSLDNVNLDTVLYYKNDETLTKDNK